MFFFRLRPVISVMSNSFHRPGLHKQDDDDDNEHNTEDY